MVSDGLRWSQMVSDGLGWSFSVDLDYHRMVLNTQTYKWIGLGLGLDGTPGGRGYRAPYGANKISLNDLFSGGVLV